MSKIKELIEKIKNNGTEYNDLSFLISKRVWLVVASLYYLAFLFTVGGFYFGPITLDYLAMITFHLYSILVVATAWFIYSLCEYGINIYVPERKWLLIVAIIFCASFTIIALTSHLGII